MLQYAVPLPECAVHNYIQFNSFIEGYKIAFVAALSLIRKCS